MDGKAKAGAILSIVAFSLMCLFGLIVFLVGVGLTITLFSEGILIGLMIIFIGLLPVIGIIQGAMLLNKPTKKRRLQYDGASIMMLILLVIGSFIFSLMFLIPIILFLIASILLFVGDENQTNKTVKAADENEIANEEKNNETAKKGVPLDQESF